jgi:hypothetical protein
MKGWASAVSILLVGLTPSVVTGQTVAPPPQTVEAAEAEGARHPKTSAMSTDHAMYAEAFGPLERRCVDAEKHVTARSGEFVAGPFDRHVLMAGNLRRKVWWAPKQTAVVPPMQLRAVKVGAPEVTVTWTFTSVASNENGVFFPTTVRFPEGGKWLVVVTSGDNWGCFLLDEIDLPKR